VYVDASIAWSRDVTVKSRKVIRLTATQLTVTHMQAVRRTYAETATHSQIEQLDVRGALTEVPE
jgi:hypothetical protein